ncbi:MAG: peroxidase-related enzyme [Acidobacteriia bacterium]|nr:peroxidase-related enzyme [Terriglobia bacterium]
MTWIKTVSLERATGRLKKEFEAAIGRAGRVFNIVSAQSLNPRVLHASLNLYKTVMLGSSSLSRVEREMIAVVVSKTAGCVYWTEAHGEYLRQLTHDDRLVRLIKIDYRMLLLEDRVRSMLDFAVQVTREVHSINRLTIEELRAKGLSDEDILNVVQVAGFFSYYTRLADALGVEPEPSAPAKVHQGWVGEDQADPAPEKVE